MNKVSVEKQRQGYKEELVTSLPHLLDPASTVESIVTTALKASAQKMGLDDIAVFVTRLKQCDPVAFNYYCHNIAKELGEVLGSWSKNIKVVYTCSYDEAAEDCLEKLSTFSPVHMIIWAKQKNQALNALIETMDGAMVKHHRHLLGLDKLEHMLDAQVVDDEDVKNRTGYAALLKSIYQPPIEVWRSSPGI